MSNYNPEYYRKNAERFKAAARARYRAKFGGLKRGKKMNIEIPDKEAFDTLKYLLHRAIYTGIDSASRSPSELRTTDALKRIYNPIRDVEFPNV